MSVSAELMKAILAMDSYNRGYKEGLVGVGNTIGTAMLSDESGTEANTPGYDAGFYAAAYNYNGETVISFRGTDNFSLVDGDPVTGWGVD